MSIYGKSNGVTLTQELLDEIEANAVAGFPGVDVVEYARHSPMPPANDEALNVRIPAGIKRAIEMQAAKRHVTQSVIVRDALSEWLEEQDLVPA